VLSLGCYLDYDRLVMSVVISTTVKLLCQLLLITKVLSLSCYLDYGRVVISSLLSRLHPSCYVSCYRSQKCYLWDVISTIDELLSRLLSRLLSSCYVSCYRSQTCYLWFVISTIDEVLSPVCYLDYSQVVISLVIDNKVVIPGLLSRLHSTCYPIDHLTIVTGSWSYETSVIT
jgi:hypothetical protein